MTKVNAALLATLMVFNLALPISVRGADNIVPPGSIPTENERKEYERIDKELARIDAGLADKSTLAPKIKSLKTERGKLLEERKKIDAERARKSVWIPGAMYYTDPKPSENRRTVAPWNREIVRRDTPQNEDDVVELSVFDLKGKAAAPPLTFRGEVSVGVMETRKRVLVAIRSSHFKVTKSYLLNEDGKQIKALQQDSNVLDYAIADDGNVFWRLTATVKDGRPQTELEVFDFDGNQIESRLFDKASKAEIRIDRFGTIYRIDIPKPDYPG